VHEDLDTNKDIDSNVLGGRRTCYVYGQLSSSGFLKNSILQSRLEIPDIVSWAPANVACCSAAKLNARLLPKFDKYTWQVLHLAMTSVTGRGYACESFGRLSIKQITTAGFPYFAGDFRIAYTNKHLTMLVSSSATSEAFRMTIHV